MPAAVCGTENDMKKQFIIGYIAGAATFGAIGALAAGLTAAPNPFPVMLDGESAAIEGYNIEGSTYFKLRDIADAVGGFTVDFAEDTILIETKKDVQTPAVSPSPVPELTESFSAEAGELIKDFKYELVFAEQTLPQLTGDRLVREIKGAYGRTGDKISEIEALCGEYADDDAAERFLAVALTFSKANRSVYETLLSFADELFPDFDKAEEEISSQLMLMNAALEQMEDMSKTH